MRLMNIIITISDTMDRGMNVLRWLLAEPSPPFPLIIQYAIIIIIIINYLV